MICSLYKLGLKTRYKSGLSCNNKNSKQSQEIETTEVSNSPIIEFDVSVTPFSNVNINNLDSNSESEISDPEHLDRKIHESLILNIYLNH